jgi:hypothetical protein
MVYFNTVLNTTIYNYLKVFALSHGNMFRLYIQPSSGLKEISPRIKSVYCMGSHILLQDFVIRMYYTLGARGSAVD